MSLTRTVCSECGVALKSSSGFVVGKTICCPKCETYFTVEEPAEEEGEVEEAPRKKQVQVTRDDEVDDDDNRPKKKKKKKKAKESYKNHSLRYAILGVLVTAMLVLGVFLILNKKHEAKEQARADESSPPADSQKLPPPSLPRVNQGDPSSPKMQKQFWEPTEGPPDEPAMNEPAAKKFRETLIGKWRMEFENNDKKPDSATIEYKSNGVYVAVVHDREENRRESMTGTWKGVKTFIDPNDGRPIGLVVEITLQRAFTQKLEIVFNPPDEILQQYFGPPTGVKLFLLKYARVKD